MAPKVLRHEMEICSRKPRVGTVRSITLFRTALLYIVIAFAWMLWGG